MLSNFWNRFFQQTILYEGSTRPIGLLRIATVLILWARWGRAFSFHRMADKGELTLLLAILFFVLTFLVLIGLWTRIVAPLLGVLMLGLFFFQNPLGINPHAMRYAHHEYMLVVMTFLLSLTPCGKSYSMDFLIQRRKGQQPEESGPLWATILMGAQISCIYFWGGLHKLRPSFLSGERYEAIFMDYYFGSDYPGIPYFHEMMIGLNLLVIVVEFSLCVGFWFARTRKLSFVIGFLFHALIYVFLPVKTFSIQMMIYFLVFFPPKEVENFLEKFQVRTN